MEFKKQESNNQEQNKPEYCIKCSQFFGSPEKEKMCSKCFSEHKNGLNQNETIKKVEQDKNLNQLSINQQKDDNLLTKDSLCTTCEKRVGIFGFKCKCSMFFCKSHRLPEIHNCHFNFSQDGKKILEKNLTKCQASQLEKI